MAKSVKKNYIYNVLYQMLLLASPLITAPYAARVLCPDGIGLQSYAISVMSCFMLFAYLGSNIYGQREISYVQNDRHKRSIVFWNTFVFKAVTSLVAIVGYLIFVSFQKENTIIYLLLTLSLVAVTADISWFFQGVEDFGKTVARSSIIRILSIVFLFLFIKKKEDLWLYMGSTCAFDLIGNLVLWGYLPRYIEKTDWKELAPFKDYKVILALFVPAAATTVYSVLDKTMIGIFTDTSFENGFYEQSLKLSRMVLAIVTALGTVMIPRIGHYFSEGNNIKVREKISNGYRFVWFLGIPACLGLMGVAGHIVPWFYGPGYDKVVPLLRITSLLILAIGINNVTGVQYMVTTKRQNLYTKTIIIGACTNFALNLILIPRYFAMGAAIASVAAETLIAVVQFIYVRNEISWKDSFASCRNYLLCGLAMFALIFFEGRMLHPSILSALIMTFSGAALYLGLLFIIRDDYFISNIVSVKDSVLVKMGLMEMEEKE